MTCSKRQSGIPKIRRGRHSIEKSPMDAISKSEMSCLFCTMLHWNRMFLQLLFQVARGQGCSPKNVRKFCHFQAVWLKIAQAYRFSISSFEIAPISKKDAIPTVLKLSLRADKNRILFTTYDLHLIQYLSPFVILVKCVCPAETAMARRMINIVQVRVGHSSDTGQIDNWPRSCSQTWTYLSSQQ